MRIGQHLAILFCLLVSFHLAFAAIPNPALMKNSPNPIKLSEKQYLDSSNVAEPQVFSKNDPQLSILMRTLVLTGKDLKKAAKAQILGVALSFIGGFLIGSAREEGQAIIGGALVITGSIISTFLPPLYLHKAGEKLGEELQLYWRFRPESPR